MHNIDLRDKTLFDCPKVNSAIGQSTFKYAGAKDWNSLPLNIRETISFSKFKRLYYLYYISILFISIFYNLTISLIFVVYKNMHVYIVFKILINNS
jgi:hypothetical protein